MTEAALIQKVAQDAAKDAPDESIAAFRREIAVSSLRARLAQAHSDIVAIQRAKAELESGAEDPTVSEHQVAHALHSPGS